MILHFSDIYLHVEASIDFFMLSVQAEIEYLSWFDQESLRLRRETWLRPMFSGRAFKLVVEMIRFVPRWSCLRWKACT